MYAHEPLTHRVRALVSDGAVGAVRAITSGFTFAIERRDDVRLDPTLGGGSLWDVGCYPVTYAQLIAGRDPVSVTATAHWSARNVDDEFSGIVVYTGGATASFYSGFRAPYRTWLDVVGTEGAIRVPSPFRPGVTETLELERANGVQAIAVQGSPLLFQREVEDFVASVLDGAPPVFSLSDSRQAIATMSALYRSAREGRAISAIL